MSNNQASAATSCSTENTTKVFSEKSPIITGHENTIKVVQTFKGATPEQIDEILSIMRTQTETANIQAKIIASLLKIEM